MLHQTTTNQDVLDFLEQEEAYTKLQRALFKAGDEQRANKLISDIENAPSLNKLYPILKLYHIEAPALDEKNIPCIDETIIEKLEEQAIDNPNIKVCLCLMELSSHLYSLIKDDIIAEKMRVDHFLKQNSETIETLESFKGKLNADDNRQIMHIIDKIKSATTYDEILKATERVTDKKPSWINSPWLNAMFYGGMSSFDDYLGILRNAAIKDMATLDAKIETQEKVALKM